jgi:hypothetical protein
LRKRPDQFRRRRSNRPGNSQAKGPQSRRQSGERHRFGVYFALIRQRDGRLALAGGLLNEYGLLLAAEAILKAGRVVFNIEGNDYRLIARVQYRASVLVIRFFGTHAEYDEIDAETV